MKVRKRPVVVDVWKWSGRLEDLPEDVLQSLSPIRYTDNEDLCIPTLEGVMRCNVGDWIIRGVKGELYPCKDDIFQKTYEPVKEPSNG